MRRRYVRRSATRRGGLAVVLALVIAVASATLASPAAARARPAVESGQQAERAVAAANDEASARAALLTMFTNGGIGVEDGTGAPASEALVIVPSWELDGLARRPRSTRHATTPSRLQKVATLRGGH
jgi:hypothetical protein